MEGRIILNSQLSILMCLRLKSNAVWSWSHIISVQTRGCPKGGGAAMLQWLTDRISVQARFGVPPFFHGK